MGAVSGGLAKFETAPIPTEPVTPKPQVYPHPCRTLILWLFLNAVGYLLALYPVRVYWE